MATAVFGCARSVVWTAARHFIRTSCAEIALPGAGPDCAGAAIGVENRVMTETARVKRVENKSLKCLIVIRAFVSDF